MRERERERERGGGERGEKDITVHDELLAQRNVAKTFL